MADLDRLNHSRHERNRHNLASLARLTSQLDVPLSGLSTDPLPTPMASPSSLTQTPEPSDGDRLRDRIPARSDHRAGGNYGDAIIANVARHFGIE
jgi:hypothetical protein